MRYYPICLDVKNRRCVIVGGGEVSARKTACLLNYEANIVVISPQITKEINALVQGKKIEWIDRNYQGEDLKDAFFVVVATNDHELNKQISQEARDKGMLVNMVDSAEDSTCILPAVLSRGSLSIAVSTEGKSPALAKKIRDDLSVIFGREYIGFVELLGSLRQIIKTTFDSQTKRCIIWNKLLNSELLELLKKGRTDMIDTVLKRYGINRRKD
ncbi:bifunctional precorrin-2 dehydrogenase/sirohydrochlorin ferrochelatase [bacterium]|nr:bifunctional precorrin-2 dehydrogenase/sirohydrochlorin ferrochelatase [bacterium]MBU1753159.1 bifunctional precorrin-2 dehydrogenase/sirohydrochlorin ferrochelatase [bacterium]